MRALTLEPEYWLVLAGVISARLASSSCDTKGGPGEKKKDFLLTLMKDNVHDKLKIIVKNER